ncbi:MAG: type II toxin-antitoxin system RelE/ParE family toxin [Bacteroidetes bacterium]|nr:type II toxin-antitoxin system RelE/ParE family toxin [Bacteroidota bacterium]
MLSFEKSVKPLLKKYRSLEGDLLSLISSLEEQPESGTNLGENIFKVRLAIQSKGKGKSGGARVITYYANEHHKVFLLYIYDKSEQSTVTKEQLKTWVQEAIWIIELETPND